MSNKIRRAMGKKVLAASLITTTFLGLALSLIHICEIPDAERCSFPTGATLHPTGAADRPAADGYAGLYS